VQKEAFYHKEYKSMYRSKYIEVICDCGKIKNYREDKVFRGSYKSCGCIWESNGKKKSWSHLERTYNLSKDDFDSLSQKQNNVCAICKCSQQEKCKSHYLFVDHCHKTGSIRGLLCDVCNRGLGYFKDDVSRLQSAIAYIEEYAS
jgi:hypothetical protein